MEPGVRGKRWQNVPLKNEKATQMTPHTESFDSKKHERSLDKKGVTFFFQTTKKEGWTFLCIKLDLFVIPYLSMWSTTTLAPPIYNLQIKQA